ncbi:MAG: lamin tail domain-containing protein [Bacteroidota bacterium]
MKTFFLCIVCCVFIIDTARGQVKDDFSDGNFTENPVWTGDIAQFEVNSARQLQLHSTGTDTSVLVTHNARMTNTEWSFMIKLAFNTSSNNFARIYLASDTSALQVQLNGYFLQVGGMDDSISVVRQTGTKKDKIFSFKSYKTVHSANTLRVKIIRNEDGWWDAMVDTTGGYNYVSEGSFFDDTFQSSRWFGILCRYTSSNATKYIFDDFYIGPVIHDTIPPKILSQEMPKANTVRLSFSESILKEDAENSSNYLMVTTGARPDSVRIDLHIPSCVNLFFQEFLSEGMFDSLRIQNIRDLSGNRLFDTTLQLCFYRAKSNDILIHEIMADPDPPVDLPNIEYIELFNRTTIPVNLKGWKIAYGNYSKVFQSMILPPKGFLLIVKDSVYLSYASCAVLFTSSSSLSNEGTTLVLKDSMNHVIHSVSYSPDWYQGSFKEEGGWSLEMIDPLNPCGCGENWNASIDASGGTPGRGNSISGSNPDVKAPCPVRAIVSDTSILTVYFSEAMDSSSLESVRDWSISPFEDYPAGVVNPDKVIPVSPDFSSAKLLLNTMFKRGVTYFLHITGGQKDCSGNQCDSTATLRFAIPDTVSCHDIVINELLSDPANGGARFVELYNRSEKIIDMRSLVLSDSDTTGGMLPNSIPLMTKGYLLFPGDYIALTSKPADICERYRLLSSQNIVGMTGFPAFGDDTGTVLLARKDNLVIIDKMLYNPEMHYPLLATREGVSLERTNPDLPSDDKTNWHSAAETVGFATPGYQNSHRPTSGATDQEISIEPEIFSPDNDGRDDLLNIIIREREPDCSVNIRVFDFQGRLIRQLANNILSGSEGVFVWDGMTASRSKAPIGYYVLLIEITHPDGSIRTIKKTAILAAKL